MSKQPTQLSDLQLAVLRVLWECGEATAAQVHARLGPERGIAPTTVSTLLVRLEKYGYVTHTTEGRKFVYRPTMAEAEAQRTMANELAERVFDGDLPSLFNQLLDAKDLRTEDLAKIKELIAQREREIGSD